MGISFGAGSDPAAVMAADEPIPVVVEPEEPVAPAAASVKAPAAAAKLRARDEIRREQGKA